MKKLALIAVASLFAVSGAASGAFASLSVGDSPAWQAKSAVEVAGRDGGKGDRDGRNDGGKGRDTHHDRKGGKVIWRHRGKHNQLFFLFRGRGDCKTRAVETRDDSGNIVVRNRWVCN